MSWLFSILDLFLSLWIQKTPGSGSGSETLFWKTGYIKQYCKILWHWTDLHGLSIYAGWEAHHSDNGVNNTEGEQAGAQHLVQHPHQPEGGGVLLCTTMVYHGVIAEF